MNQDLHDIIADWRLREDIEIAEQIEMLLEPLLARGRLPDKHQSFTALLVGEQYHLGGAQDTRRMAQLAGISACDQVIDLACYIGGPARQLARECSCEVVCVDISPVHIVVAQAVTRLCGLDHKVSFICASADAVPLPDASFTVAWSQCSLPANLGWLAEMNRLLAHGGRLAFTLPIRRSREAHPGVLSLEQVVDKVTALGYRLIHAQDISEWEIEHGWMPAHRKLRENEAHYRALMGRDWVRRAHERLDADIAEWRSGVTGDGRVVAVKETR